MFDTSYKCPNTDNEEYEGKDWVNEEDLIIFLVILILLATLIIWVCMVPSLHLILILINCLVLLSCILINCRVLTKIIILLANFTFPRKFIIQLCDTVVSHKIEWSFFFKLCWSPLVIISSVVIRHILNKLTSII